MAKVCQVTGRKRMVGNNVSHSKRRTKRVFALNLKTKKFWSEEEQRFITLKVSCKGSSCLNLIIKFAPGKIISLLFPRRYISELILYNSKGLSSYRKKENGQKKRFPFQETHKARLRSQPQD